MPKPLDDLVNLFSYLPGIGKKSAQRIVFGLIQNNKELASQLARSIQEAVDKIRPCKNCQNLTDKEICDLCSSAKRNKNQLCVVESPSDLSMIENSRIYDGQYFVLMGRLSPIDGIGPEELKLEVLQQRVANEPIEEVILATNATVEGDATAFLIREMLSDQKIKITRIAQGVPLGGELEMVDSGTIQHAFNGRQEFKTG